MSTVWAALLGGRLFLYEEQEKALFILNLTIMT